MKRQEKTFFHAGDVVMLKQSKELDYAPKMFVTGAVNKRFVQEQADDLKGIECCWFTKDYVLQKGVFSTKDLLLIRAYNEK